MNVVAVEMGDRPIIMTKARRFAPEGAKLLAEVLGHMQFAEDGIIVLDWSNELGIQPNEAAVPVLVIQTGKHVPEVDNRLLTVEVRLDVEDVFGRDEVTAEQFLDIIHQMEAKMNASIEQAKGT